MKKNLQPILWGIGLIVIGVLLFLDFSGKMDINLWGYVLGLFFLFSGISSIINSNKSVFGYFLVLLGIFIILKNAIDFNFRMIYLLPIIIIVAGLSFIASIFFNKSFTAPTGSAFVIFSGREDRTFAPDYKGSSITCVFGGYDIDLRDHDINNDIHYNIFTMFGGVDITVPDNVNVVLNPTSVFGGISNVSDNKNDNEYTIYINAFCLFGGVEVNNKKKRK